jgi:hypothetical protein
MSKERWVRREKEHRVVPEIDAFLADINEVCKRHGLYIHHEDDQGAFEIVECDSGGLEHAIDGRG